MKTLLKLSTAISLAFTLGGPVYAGDFANHGITKNVVTTDWVNLDTLFTGQSSSRGDDDDDDDDDDRDDDQDDDDDDWDDSDDRDDDRDDDNSDDNSDDDSGRSKPRVPGGSGCDDPEDILEHPECTIGIGAGTGAGNTAGSDSGRDPRVPGGSGCDTRRDWLEHIECRL